MKLLDHLQTELLDIRSSVAVRAKTIRAYPGHTTADDAAMLEHALGKLDGLIGVLSCDDVRPLVEREVDAA